MARKGVPGLVSVVVASYNHAEYLLPRMESLLKQTYQPLEILVIDDCSTDDSATILRGYENHPRIKLSVRKQNGGWVSVTREGVERSTGEFILFAQCDDECDPQMVERLVAGMERHPSAGITFCRSLLVDEQGQELGDDFVVREASFRARCTKDTLIRKEEMARFLLHSCVIPNMSAALIRRECFEILGGLSTDYRACNDWEFFFRVVTKYDVGYVAEPLNKFRQHATTIRSLMKGRATYEEFLRLLLGQIKTLDLTWRERSRFRLHVMYLWAMHLLSPSQKGYRNFPFHFRQVLSLDPVSLVFLAPSLAWRLSRVVGRFIADRLLWRHHSPAKAS